MVVVVTGAGVNKHNVILDLNGVRKFVSKLGGVYRGCE